MKKLTALILTLTLVLALTACGGSKKEEAKTESTETAETYTVGICQLVQHVALDDATQGFIDALNEKLPGQVNFNNQNASNEIPMCSTIVNQFIAEEVDLILANATPALQAASAATGEIPVLGTFCIIFSISNHNTLGSMVFSYT